MAALIITEPRPQPLAHEWLLILSLKGRMSSKSENNEPWKVKGAVAPESIVQIALKIVDVMNLNWKEIWKISKLIDQYSFQQRHCEGRQPLFCLLALPGEMLCSVWVRYVPVFCNMKIQGQTDYFGFLKCCWFAPSRSWAILEQDLTIVVLLIWFDFSQTQWTVFHRLQWHLLPQWDIWMDKPLSIAMDTSWSVAGLSIDLREAASWQMREKNVVIFFGKFHFNSVELATSRKYDHLLLSFK